MIIRDAKVDTHLFLTPNGELHAQNKLDGEVEELFQHEWQKAFLKGQEEGEKNGYAKAQEELKSFNSLLQAIATKLMEHRKQLLVQLKPEVIDFALRVSEKIIRSELSRPETHIKLIQSLINQATKALPTEQLTLYLCPEDLHFVQHHLQAPSLHFFPDPLMRRGDCRIEAKSGLLNANITRELDDLRTRITCQNV